VAPSRRDVVRGLNLPDELAPWLDALEHIGPPAAPLDMPRDDDALRVLRRLGVVEPDLSAIVASVPTPTAHPELWWLLERATHLLVDDIGRWDATTWLPSLPSDLGVYGRCFWVFVFMATADAVHAWHTSHGIPDEISWATLADLGLNVARYRRRNGVTGLDSQFWLGLHWRGALYAFGRLQFNPFRLRRGPAGPLFWYEGAALEARSTAFQPGAPVLGVHIPAGSPLDPAQCDASFEAAAAFFPRVFPAHASRLVVCTSWLLDEQLVDYLPAESNIVRFQRRFELVPGAEDYDDSICMWVFDRPSGALAEVSPRTQLERIVVDHLRAGHHWRLRTGWLEI
jgi:hypothetical protein